MIELFFEPDEESAQKSRRVLRFGLDLPLLAEELFSMPVWLRIGDVTLIPGYGIPIFGAAVDGLEALETLQNSQPKRMALPRGLTIDLQMDDGIVSLSSGPRGSVHATAQYDELLDVWRQFVKSVMVYLVARLPKLPRHRLVKDWLQEHSDLFPA